MERLKHCVFPVAGLGTRFLPATKETPKEMLPLVDKPLIHYGVEEAVASGCSNVVFVTGRGKRSIEDYFDRSHDLETMLSERGKDELAEYVRSISQLASFSYVRQSEPLGLGHAVLCASSCCYGGYFGVILPDDVIISKTPVIAQLDRVRRRMGGSVLALEEVRDSDVGRYGIVDAEKIDHGIYRIKGMVEKPESGAPSNLAIMGRYVLSSNIFGYLENQGKGSGGEYQLTDAMAAMLEDEPVFGLIYEGERLDCGTKEGWLRATVRMAMRDEQLRLIIEDAIRGR